MIEIVISCDMSQPFVQRMNSDPKQKRERFQKLTQNSKVKTGKAFAADLRKSKIHPTVKRLTAWRKLNRLSQRKAVTVLAQYYFHATFPSLRSWEEGRRSPNSHRRSFGSSNFMSLAILPVRKPCPSGPQATRPMPSSSQSESLRLAPRIRCAHRNTEKGKNRRALQQPGKPFSICVPGTRSATAPVIGSKKNWTGARSAPATTTEGKALKRPSDTSNFLPFPSATRIRGSLTIMPSASFWIGASAGFRNEVGLRIDTAFFTTLVTSTLAEAGGTLLGRSVLGAFLFLIPGAGPLLNSFSYAS
jgi:hypothetical protein